MAAKFKNFLVFKLHSNRCAKKRNSVNVSMSVIELGGLFFFLSRLE